ncbi:hypothetical protein [Caulobacter sp. BK020]|uniref:hypothetical protein n=1 Tax=Caulobacter sp. BK020 TaxID=2512117 RepID=UPI00104C7498|nr:hypothetical protein [Caulobacter sp. BK020]TCS18134.1 hypothetical protein EV278_101115 [Caulobacter sp. BK020]
MLSVFRRSKVLLAVAVLMGAVTPALAGPKDFSKEIAEVGQLARLDGQPVLAGEFESPQNPLFDFAGVDNGREGRALIMQRALNSFRAKALDVLAPKMLANCPVEATAADLQAFYPYWRRLVALEQKRLADLGVEDVVEPPVSPFKGMTLAPNAPLTELAQVDARTAGAEPLAADAVRRWKTYHCVQATYGGDAFFTIAVDRDGLNWPVGPMLTGKPMGHRSVRVPDTGNLEPITALGRFFRDAEKRGLLTFDNPQYRAYFFERYEGRDYDKMKEPTRAKAFLDQAPWAVEGPYAIAGR